MVVSKRQYYGLRFEVPDQDDFDLVRLEARALIAHNYNLRMPVAL